MDCVVRITSYNVCYTKLLRNEQSKIKETLRLFILSLNQHTETTLELDLLIPKQIAEKEAIGSQGKAIGIYNDFAQESMLLASLVIDVFIEESVIKPLFSRITSYNVCYTKLLRVRGGKIWLYYKSSPRSPWDYNGKGDVFARKYADISRAAVGRNNFV